MRSAIRNAALQAAGKDVQVILAGLSNIYSSYVTTPEEYQIQRYEGASTAFGPHTLTIYMDQYQKLTVALLKDERIDSGPRPPYLDNAVISLTAGVIYDGTPLGRSFGSVIVEPELVYRVKNTVRTRFQAANPRNNLMHEKTYFIVEKLMHDGHYEIVATDASWETK